MNSAEAVMLRLAQMQWDVGDQGRSEGYFLALAGKKAFKVWVEGWGLECLDGQYASFTPTAQKKLKTLAVKWAQASHSDAHGVYTGVGDAAYVAFRIIELKSKRDLANELDILDEEDVLSLE